MSVLLPNLPPRRLTLAVFLSFFLKLLGKLGVCSYDATAAPSPTERGGQCLHAWAGSQGAPHARHRVCLGAAEV